MANPGLPHSDRAGWTSQLQAIVDEASRVLGRPVAIDDRHSRLLAYTPHTEGDVDRVRLLSIMKQPLPAEFVEWIGKNVDWSAERPFRVPPNATIEYAARVAAPLRCQGHHLGFMWCTDRDQTMSDADLERMAVFADEAAAVLYRETLLHDLERSRERELLRDILGPDEAIRRRAAWQLAELGLFTPTGRSVVLVIPLDDAGVDRPPDDASVAIESALMRVRRHFAPKHGLHLVRPDHALVVASLADPGIRADGLHAFAERIHGEIRASLSRNEDGQRDVVAVGGAVKTVADSATSYQQALRAAKVASTVSTFGDVICWDDLGIYQMLTEIPVDVFGDNALHPGFKRLLDDPRARYLIATLERYLDRAGDMQQTAASLFLHRTSLYYRLRRIEQLAEVNLGEGDHRLALHLSLKIARLRGITWPTHTNEEEANGD